MKVLALLAINLFLATCSSLVATKRTTYPLWKDNATNWTTYGLLSQRNAINSLSKTDFGYGNLSCEVFKW